MAETIRVAVGLPGDATDEQLTLAKQMGCSGVVLATPKRLPGDQRWEAADLIRLREWVESYDLRLEAIQNWPATFVDKVRLGLPGRDEQIEHCQATIRNLGRAEIPILGYNWRPNQLYRTGTQPGRGGAEVTTFNLAKARDLPLSHGRIYSAEEDLGQLRVFRQSGATGRRGGRGPPCPPSRRSARPGHRRRRAHLQ